MITILGEKQYFEDRILLFLKKKNYNHFHIFGHCAMFVTEYAA